MDMACADASVILKDEDFIETLDEYNEPEILQANPNSHDYLYEGVRIEFPYEAYNSQQQMMHKIITGLKNCENCLLESPTGTGKTAAILCALLAWKRNCNEQGRNFWKLTGPEQICTCRFDRDVDETTVVEFEEKYTLFVKGKAAGCDVSVDQAKSNCAGSPAKKMKEEEVLKELKADVKYLCRFCQVKYVKPRIIYATRTHSQIKQVVEQLKQTVYNSTPMHILASRKQTCINSNAKCHPTKSVDDACLEMRETEAKLKRLQLKGIEKVVAGLCCEFYSPGNDPKNFLDFPLDDRNGDITWDIEDLVKAGGEREACPYYGSRFIRQTAEIIFCSYNYLVYPFISRASNIFLTNAVVVFDEAHNIEQLCRDVSSQTILLEDLDFKVRVSFDEVLQYPAAPRELKTLCEKYSLILQNMSSWVKNQQRRMIAKRDDFSGYFIKEDDITENFVEIFESLKLGKENISEIHEDLDRFSDLSSFEYETERGKKKKKKLFIMNQEGIRFLNRLRFTLSKLYFRDNLKHFKTLLVKKSIGTVSKHIKVLPKDFKFKMELQILCLNPAIAFERLKKNCRTIIVASGTLSPIDSFSSELNAEFKQTIQAPHIIDESRFAVQLVTNNPHQISSKLVFNSTNQTIPEYQDDLGKMILSICRVIPNGVLVFLPSYGFMNKLKHRWREIPGQDPFLAKLNGVKQAFFEESDTDKFKKDIKKYREQIKDGVGCIYFGVFRGKLSEGVDFKDEQARAVISVGIPYPSPVDPNIKYKKEYNDEVRKLEPKYLTGSDWYSTQAFRALNQGLGRCIRHKDDWGVIFILDSRIVWNKSKLPRWVQQFIKVSKDFDKSLHTIRSFVLSKIVPTSSPNSVAAISASHQLALMDVDNKPSDLDTSFAESDGYTDESFLLPPEELELLDSLLISQEFN